MEAFATALQQLPTIIADNGGFDSSQLVAELRATHAEGNKTMGLDMEQGRVRSYLPCMHIQRGFLCPSSNAIVHSLLVLTFSLPCLFSFLPCSCFFPRLQVADVQKLGITESFQVKSQVVVSAEEAAEMVLRVDNILRSAPRQRAPHHH